MRKVLASSSVGLLEDAGEGCQEGPGQEGAGAHFLGAVPVSRAVLVQGWVSDSRAASAVLGADSGLLCGPRVRFQRGLKTPPPA